MPTPTLLHWVVLVLAGFFAGAGLVVFYRALFHDRPRGRRRCPKCWYEMTGVAGLKCPECGREARTERKLFKTHRRWRWAALGMLAILLAGSLAVGQRIYELGWDKSRPTFAYIAALPWLEQESVKELSTRARSGTLAQWEYRLLVRAAASDMRRADASWKRIALGRLIAEVHMGGRERRLKEPYLSWGRTTEIDWAGPVDALVTLLDDPDAKVRSETLFNLAMLWEDAAPAIPALLARASNEHDGEQQMLRLVLGRIDKLPPGRLGYPDDLINNPVLGNQSPTLASAELPRERLLACGANKRLAIPVFMAMLQSANASTRALAVWALGNLGADDPPVRTDVLALFADSNLTVRRMVTGFASRCPLSEQTADIVSRAIADPEIGNSGLAAAALFSKGGERLLPAIRPRLDDLNPLIVFHATEAWVKCGGDSAAAAAVLVPLIQAPSDDGPRSLVMQTGALYNAAKLGEGSPDLRLWLEHS